MEQIQGGSTAMSTATLEYFEEYRTKVAAADNINNQVNELERQAARLSTEYKMMRNELAAMEKIITLMIQNGWDPVEAKLRTDENERQQTFWYRSDNTNDHLMQNTGSISITGATHAIGAIGATGASCYYKYNTGTVAKGSYSYDPLAAGAGN